MSSLPSPEIRRAKVSDYDALCECFKELDALHVSLLPDIFRPFDGPVRPVELFNEKVSEAGKALFIALSGTQVAGFVDIQRSLPIRKRSVQ